jgi:protein TonB
VAAFPLQLEVEAQGEGLNIRWNPQSMPVTQAREGRLAILESDQPSPRIVPLDLQQLAGGHIFYRPSTERVQFQLEIVDVSGGISKESVLALTSTAAPAIPPVAPPHAGSMQNPAAQVRSIPIPNANTPPPLANTTEAPPKAQPAPRTFTAPPSNRDRIGQVPVIALDQPPTISANTVLPTTVALPATLNNLPPPQAQELPPVKEPLATKRIKVGSLQAANLIKRVTPVYPPMAAAMHIQGTVRFAATIGKDGTVRNLQLISGNAALVKSATDAVKQWIYRPTLLNGDPVEVLTQITVDFALRP